LIKYLIPGIITSAGLAWKSGIAAEIIAYTSDSIGREIYNAKAFLESERMLAWTMVVIILSLIFEATLSFIGRRLVNGKSKG
jgi:NitT/TauT family transport system permease protein